MSETRHTVDPKFVMKRQGKDMVLYAGLVDAAHRAGLLGISTEILQFPTQDNDQTTIVRAVATFPVTWMESPETGDEIAVSAKRFTGIGDANPRNVGPNIVPHAIRMAETRAKARALRDALNVGMVTVEELGGDDEAQSPAPRRSEAPAPVQRAATAPQPARLDARPGDYGWTELWIDLKQHDIRDRAAVVQYLGKPIDGWSPSDIWTAVSDKRKAAAR